MFLLITTYIYFKKNLKQFKYKPDSIYETLLIKNSLRTVVPTFLNTLPAPLYAVIIALKSSLYLFQKSLYLLVQPSLNV